MKKQAEGYVNPRTAAALAAFMSALPGTKSQIAARAGLSKSKVGSLVTELHCKKIRICDWLPHPVRGPSIPVYEEGIAPDALDTRPRLTRKQIHERFEMRIKGTEKADQRRAKRISLWWEKKAVAVPHSWFSALFLGVRAGSMSGEG